jgi:hypothetical protein
VHDRHLHPLVQAGVPPFVWEDKETHEKGSRTVLTIAPAATKGQELLFDYLGNYSYNDYTQYVRTLRFWFCAENVCLIDGQMPVSPPIISESQELVHHNLLLASLFVALTKAQAMQRFQINPSKNLTIAALMDASFPPIKATDNIKTPYSQDNCLHPCPHCRQHLVASF